MDVSAFREGLLNDVETRAEAEHDFALSAFVNEASLRLAEAEVIEALTPVYYRGVGSRQRKLAVDGFDLDDADDSIALAITEFDGSVNTPRMTSSEAKRSFSMLEAFLAEATAGTFSKDREKSSREYELALDLHNRGRAVSRYRLYLLTDHQLVEKAREFPSSTLNGVPVDYHIWDIRRFWEVNESVQGREELTIDLREWRRDGLPALEVKGGADFTTYLAAIPGAMLADLYHRHGSRLLESNVRSFLSARGKVNKGIRTTLQSEPQMFLAFNNGITATATGVRTNGEGHIETITDLQIVNGGQTTASLFYVRREARGPSTSLADVHVQMKLVVVDPVRSKELVPNISRFANSQNRVSEADFFSNSPFHVRMETISRRLMAPQQPGVHYQSKWYYERNRGQYQNDRAKLATSEQRKFDLVYPRRQLITKTDAAKYEVSWNQRPHMVSAGAQKNFMAFAQSICDSWEKSPEQFNEEYFRDLVSKAILFNSVRGAVARQEWYQQGYLANIVAYTLAKLSFDIDTQVPKETMNFKVIWDEQAVPEAMMSHCLVVARAAFGVLTAEDRPVLNVTEWAKKEDAWSRLKMTTVPLTSEFKAMLLSKRYVHDVRSSAKDDQRIDSGIELQIAILRVPVDEWNRLWIYCSENQLITSIQRGVLEKMRRPGFLPTERQAGVLARLERVAVERGFRPPLRREE